MLPLVQFFTFILDSLFPIILHRLQLGQKMTKRNFV